MVKRASKPSQLSPQLSDEKKIASWLKEEGIWRQEQPDPHCHFNFLVDFKGQPVQIVNPKTESSKVAVVVGIKIADETLKVIRSVAKEDVESFFWQLKLELLWKSVDYRFEMDGGIPIGIQFTRELFISTITKDKLWDAMLEVQRCMVFYIWTVNRRFGPKGKKDTLKSPLYQ